MWTDLVKAAGGFHSTRRSGKWIFESHWRPPEATWADVRQAALAGLLVAAKRSSPVLERRRGGVPLFLAYAADSSPAEARAVLEILRSVGVHGPARFKTDAATMDGIEQDLYVSGDFEDGFVAEAPPGMPDVLELPEGDLMLPRGYLGREGGEVSVVGIRLSGDVFRTDREACVPWSMTAAGPFWTGDAEAVRHEMSDWRRLDPLALRCLLDPSAAPPPGP